MLHPSADKVFISLYAKIYVICGSSATDQVYKFVSQRKALGKLNDSSQQEILLLRFLAWLCRHLCCICSRYRLAHFSCAFWLQIWGAIHNWVGNIELLRNELRIDWIPPAVSSMSLRSLKRFSVCMKSSSRHMLNLITERI